MKRSFLLLTALIFIISCNRMDQGSSSDESGVALTWSFRENSAGGDYYSAEFVLQNLKDKALTDQGWALYFNQQGLGVLDETVTGNVEIRHINGDWLSITPREGFILEPDASVKIAYHKPGSFLLQSEAPLHPYMVYEGTDEESQAVLHAAFEDSDAFVWNGTGPTGGAWTPGSTDISVFHPQVSGATEFRMAIFTRLGHKIFETHEVYVGWDGYVVTGDLAAPGVYIYKAWITYSGGKQEVITGDVTFLYPQN